LSDDARAAIWRSAAAILRHGGPPGAEPVTGLALGYVQSGKTTAFSALTTMAADEGYRLIIAFLGATRLLLEQNRSRLEVALGLDARRDYVWQTVINAKGVKGGREVADFLGRGRTVVVPVLKNAGRINDLASALERVDLSKVRTLVVDDEADQASLNTKVASGEESRTYAAIARVRATLGQHLYVQYTATPYAPLLLEPADDLRPDFVELLHPGPGYTGGREFFVDHADQVVRVIPDLDEQAPRGLPTMLPGSLVSATASFLAGAAMLLVNQAAQPPISMLVHSTHKNDVQSRYHFLLGRKVKQWRKAVAVGELPTELLDERARLVAVGAVDVTDMEFAASVGHALGETTLWLVNSASAVSRIDWRSAPLHILVGGNKLDRGFTVEGLTVTYMNRPASPQIDTLEQRARAFGYRQDLLPYCQFFATARSVETLRGTVYTEYDLRAELRDWLDGGGDVQGWAERVGLMLPPGTRPTRENVLVGVDRFNVGGAWHQLRRPSLAAASRAANLELVQALGLSSAPTMTFGRNAHRVLSGISLREIRERLVEPWNLDSYSPGWDRRRIEEHLARHPRQDAPVRLVHLERPDGGPRDRAWDSELGLGNLLQGPDPSGAARYPGDRNLFDHDADPLSVEVQVHRVRPRGLDVDEVMTLAVYLGDRVALRRSPTRSNA
jgi:Z1 domain